MTERRRFFPARRALAVPGTTSYVHAQLRPQETAMPTECPIDIAGPALLPEWRYIGGQQSWAIYDAYYEHIYGIVGYSFVPPDDGWEIDDEGYYRPDAYTAWKLVEEEDSIKHGSGYELPACTFSADGRMTRCWVNIGEIQRPLRFRAVLLARSAYNIKWTANLDIPPLQPNFARDLGELWPGGVDVEDEGHSMLIRVHPGKKAAGGGVNGAPWVATLTLEASAGGKPAGSLTMHLGWRVKRVALGEQGQQYNMNGWDGWKPSDDKETV